MCIRACRQVKSHHMSPLMVEEGSDVEGEGARISGAGCQSAQV